ncbi:MAG: hypothetical protein BWX84_00094 [Verrucomicrobia bacterium ADurb.Bin118]|nr:MAG: hypothetical protein BWX84_00094 [Verrucomicrobia bacterium ADurb.Bin118]
MGEDHHAILVFELFNEDIHLPADLHGVNIHELVDGDGPLAFIADIHQHFLGADFDDGTGNNFANGKAHGALLHGIFHGEHNNMVF